MVDVDSVEANRPWRQANRPLSAQTRDGLRARMRNSDFYDTASPESATSQAAKPSAPKPAAERESEEGAGAAEGARISAKGWKPPLGYVGVKTICSDERFRKNGKNPARTTIHAWIKCGQRTGIPVSVLKAPDSQEVHVPENWVMDQISTWNPRT